MIQQILSIDDILSLSLQYVKCINIMIAIQMRHYIFFCGLCACMLLSCSKENTSLPKPENLQLTNTTENSVTIQWKSVKKATHYLYTLTIENQSDSYYSHYGSTQENKITLNNLEPHTPYLFKVCCSDQNTTVPGGEGGPGYLRSDWSEIVFTCKYPL